jgi:uncharacterized protein (UPF0335 family)
LPPARVVRIAPLDGRAASGHARRSRKADTRFCGSAMSDVSEPIQGDQLKSIVQRIERLEEEKKTIADDIKEVYAEAKANGYDVKVLRKVIAIRKRDLRERREEEAVLDLYLQAVGESA